MSGKILDDADIIEHLSDMLQNLGIELVECDWCGWIGHDREFQPKCPNCGTSDDGDEGDGDEGDEEGVIADNITVMDEPNENPARCEASHVDGTELAK